MEATPTPTSGGTSSTSGDDPGKEQPKNIADPAPTSGGDDDSIVKKLKSEKDNWKDRAMKAEKANEDGKREALEKKEEYKKLYELEKESTAKTKDELSKMHEDRRKARINSEFKAQAMKLGLKAEHAADALRLADLSKVSLDPETKVVIGAEGIAKEFHEKYSHLGFFGKATPGTDGRAADPTATPPTGDDAYIAELRACKNQQEFDAVRRKHNKT